MKSDIIKITGLWKKRSKKGQEYLTGSFGPFSKVMILKNNDRKTENEPEYFICIAPKAKREEQKAQPARDALMNVNDKDIITPGRKQTGESVMKKVAEAKNKGNEGDTTDLPF